MTEFFNDPEMAETLKKFFLSKNVKSSGGADMPLGMVESVGSTCLPYGCMRPVLP